jgi:signal peptidase I
LGKEANMGSRRRPWLAALLSLLSPGIGQLYAGRGRRALALLLFYSPVELAIGLLAVLLRVPVVNLLVPALLMIGLRLVVALDAAHCARTLVSYTSVPVFSRWYSCLAGFVMVGVLVSPFWARMYRTTFVEAYRNAAGSMRPTILRDDYLLAVKWAYGWREPVTGRMIFGAREPRRADLVVFRFPEDRTRPFIKRLIGLPGETVEIRQKVDFIDGKPLREAYTAFLETPRVFSQGGGGDWSGSPLEDWGPQVVPPASYFVLGDFRDNSRDSRFWGFVPKTDLLGRATVVYWSWDAESGSVRWSRIGQRPE